uniref:Uncharacterized protein n=1 Tax=Micrurus spixii TaxID=129469 RepID=A0A2D4N7D8_9SAUR
MNANDQRHQHFYVDVADTLGWGVKLKAGSGPRVLNSCLWGGPRNSKGPARGDSDSQNEVLRPGRLPATICQPKRDVGSHTHIPMSRFGRQGAAVGYPECCRKRPSCLPPPHWPAHGELQC